MDYFGKKLIPKDKHLFWENGEPFFYLADTLWYGLTNRCTLEEFETILKDRKEKGFTAIQLVVGIPPESSPFNENAKSTNGLYAFNQKFVVNKEYFEDIKTKIDLVVRYKLVPVLFGSWGNYIQEVGTTGMKQLWNFIITYFSAYPVIYCLCGEADIVKSSLNPTFTQKVLAKIPTLRMLGEILKDYSRSLEMNNQVHKWKDVANYAFRQNKEMHPMTAHIQSAHIASEVFRDSFFLSLDSFQSGHSLRGFELMDRNFAKLQKLDLPFINLEPLYEGILDQYDVRIQTYAFFKSLIAGAAGHSYGAHGLWQMANGDNFMEHWGESQWDRALHYKGGRSLGSIRKYLSMTKKWLTIQEETEEITILFEKQPILKPLIGRYDKTIFMYIPEPQGIDRFEVRSKIVDYQVFNPLLMDVISESSDLLLLKTLFKLNNELIIEINLV